MKNLLGLGVFGTFGKPYGFQQYFYFETSFNQSLDLNTNAIEIYPDTELYSVKKEIHNGAFAICISIYTYAKEVSSGRGGTFIGSSILLIDSYTKAENIYSLLKELHSDVIHNEKNIVNNTLQVQQATQLVVKEPTNFENIKSNISSIKETGYFSNSIIPSKKFLIIPENGLQENEDIQIVKFIKESIECFPDVDTMFFTFDNNVIQYVNQKGLLKKVNWNSFINQREIIKQEKEELNRIEELKKKQEDEEKRKSQNNKHQRNTSNHYNTPNNNDFVGWQYNGQKWKAEEVKKRVQEYNRLFEYCSQLQKRTANISNTQYKTEYKFENPSTKENEYPRINYKFLFSFLLNIILLLFIVFYFLFFNDPKIEYINNKQAVQEEEVKPQITNTNKPSSADLTPTPNNELNPNDRRLIAKEKIKNKTDNEITMLVFSKNPTEIKSMYSEQVGNYAKILVTLNKECFEKKDSTFICTCDSLNHIPSFKK